MRKHALALSVLALVSLGSGAARAADKLRLERIDLQRVADAEAVPHLRRRRRARHHRAAKEDFKLIVDSAEQGAGLGAADVRRDQGADQRRRRGAGRSAHERASSKTRSAPSRALADALPPKSKMALLGYAADTKRLAELGSPADAECAAKTMAIDTDGPRCT